jgi:hypothetical protein
LYNTQFNWLFWLLFVEYFFVGLEASWISYRMQNKAKHNNKHKKKGYRIETMDAAQNFGIPDKTEHS